MLDWPRPVQILACAAVVGASNTLPPPPPSAVSHGGGVVKNPKLISSAPPVYPRAAMQAMVDGDVVIHAVIDKNGSVTEATRDFRADDAAKRGSRCRSALEVCSVHAEWRTGACRYHGNG